MNESLLDKCINVVLVKNVKDKNLKGKNIYVPNLKEGNYNLRLDDKSEIIPNVKRLRIPHVLSQKREQFDKAYASLVGGNNGT